MRVGRAMPMMRPKKIKKPKQAKLSVPPGRRSKPVPKMSGRSRRPAVEIGELVRQRAQAEAAIAEARKSNARLREAIDILPNNRAGEAHFDLGVAFRRRGLKDDAKIEQ